MNPGSIGPGEGSQGPELTKWMVGCAVAGAATIGVGILVFLVALALQPPVWVQVVLGAGLALGAAIFTWLVASAWRPSDGRDASVAGKAHQTGDPPKRANF